jgi:beta-lactamase superfamily II metal-dependent hydrolase
MLRVHFLNVGKGSCTIIEFPSGRVGMVDIDDSRSFKDEDLDNIAQLVGSGPEYQSYKSHGMLAEARRVVEEAYQNQISLCDPVQYYLAKVGSKRLFRFILTHPDMDHMSGLARLKREIGMDNFWDTNSNKEIDDESWEDSPYRKEDWDCYQSLRKSEADPKCIRPQRGDVDKYWNEDSIEILSPGPKLVALANETDEFNHISYVLRISYGERRVLLGGDASVKAWEDILRSCGKYKLKADILLAPHHGSKQNFHKEAMEAVSPKLVIVSVHVGQDYAYDEYRQLSSNPTVLSTKWWGNIVVTIQDDGKCTYTTQIKRE